jgi:pilus assembly protein FimV
MAAHHETVDPVVEADTFLAFGRDAQAEEILLEALKTDPQRQAIHLKLLDIYVARKNVSQFESVAKDLHVLTGGLGASWEKAAAMGASIDPANPLYGATAPEAQPAPVAARDEDSTMILDTPSAAEESTAPALPAAVPAPAEAVALDFDLDIGTTAPSSVAEAPTAEAVGLDFDLDLGAPEAQPSAVTPQAEIQSNVAALDISFDMPVEESSAPALDLPLAKEKPAAVETPIVAVADSGGIDFDFDLGTPESGKAAPLPEMSVDIPAAPTPASVALDLGGISLELETPAVSASAAPATAEVPDNPEVATKIELAMAYEEMGDRDGARELFQEALAEGSPAQQKSARAKLDSLG